MTVFLRRFGVLVLFSFAAPAVAAERETRTFQITIDNKPAGQYVMTIARQDDGTEIMTAQADVRVSYLVYTYKYTLRATETWKDGRLFALESTSNDDGKKFVVSAAADAEGLRVRVNGQEGRARPDVWLTTYWRLPDARYRNAAVPLLDADTGKEMSARLQYVGIVALSIGGGVQNCAHYRLSGGAQNDLWFDSNERLVRNAFVEDGHRTVIELTRTAPSK